VSAAKPDSKTQETKMETSNAQYYTFPSYQDALESSYSWHKAGYEIEILETYEGGQLVYALWIYED
jgi:hypothetical protein